MSIYEKIKVDYIIVKIVFDMVFNELGDICLIVFFDGYVGEVYIEKY